MPCAKLLMGWPPPRMFSKLKFTKFSSPEFSITLRNLEIIIVRVGWEKWHTKKVVIWFFKFLTTKGAGSIDFQWMTGRFSRQIEDYLPNNWELDGARLVYHWNEITQGQINNLRWVLDLLPSLFLMTLLTRSKISSFFATPEKKPLLKCEPFLHR